jgi:sugar/nucleoside kinase (ribokinase family)
MDARTILVVGDAFCDVNAGPLTTLPRWGTNTVSPEPILAHPGGAALNVASWLQRLRGGNVALFTGIGRDAFGDLLRLHLSSFGVRLLEAASDSTAPTGVCMVLSGPEDRAFCSHFGVADTFDASELVAHDAQALRRLSPRLGHVHCAGFYSCGALRKTLPALLHAARCLGATTSLDTNNDASGQWGEVDGLWEELLVRQLRTNPRTGAFPVPPPRTTTATARCDRHRALLCADSPPLLTPRAALC